MKAVALAALAAAIALILYGQTTTQSARVLPALTEVAEGTPIIGSINGTTQTFVTTRTPAGLVNLYYNGVRERLGTSYTVSGRTIRLAFTPQPGDAIDVDYWVVQ